ncbi:MAG: hypothetical protein LBL13_03720 [Bacteroidales bacterium]|nr:hypothetical protein [Bacteroidales bacterium]
MKITQRRGERKNRNRQQAGKQQATSNRQASHEEMFVACSFHPLILFIKGQQTDRR